jgi:hypothetical protein
VAVHAFLQCSLALGRGPGRNDDAEVGTPLRYLDRPDLLGYTLRRVDQDRQHLRRQRGEADAGLAEAHVQQQRGSATVAHELHRLLLVVVERGNIAHDAWPSWRRR